MTNNPSNQPTPVAVPTPTGYNYTLPHIPANAYHLLSNLADAIDTAKTQLTGHANKLHDINTNTNNAVGDVLTHSKGQATDALNTLWTGSQADLNTAQSQLTAITGSQGIGAGTGPADYRATLNDNASAIQTGLTALENLQRHLNVSGSVTINTPQLEQWKADVDTLDSSIANINMVIQLLVMSIYNINDNFTHFCQTGLTPGGTLPLFNKNAFAHQNQGNTSGNGSGSAGEQNLRNSLANAGITGPEADILVMDAQGSGMDFNAISNLLDHGVSGDNIKVLLSEGNTDLEKLMTDKSQKYFDDFQTGKDSRTEYSANMKEVNEIIASIYSKSEYMRLMTENNIKLTDMYNVIDDSNKDFRMTPENAITAITDAPEGSARAEVAGPGGTKGDVQFYDAKGDLIFTRENKNLTTTSRKGFERAMSAAAKEMDLQPGQHAEIFLQAQPGMEQTDFASWMRGYIGNRIKDGVAEKYRNVTINIVDPAGKVLYKNKIMP